MDEAGSIPSAPSVTKGLLLAIDAGPAQTLRPLADDNFAFPPQDTIPYSVQQWQSYLADHRIGRVIVGTSRSQQGFACESACRVAAGRAGIPVAAIEDYPGNFQVVADGHIGLLIVESPTAGSIARQRLGHLCPPIEYGASFRYDTLRGQKDRRPVRSLDLLWAGQPETDCAAIALQRLLPDIEALGARLLFRAHPRDAGYPEGAYVKLFERFGVQDVTARSLEWLLSANLRLTLTQFSSLVVELGFLGIPSVHVLYPDVGQTRLWSQNGYTFPPLCHAGGSVIIQNLSDQKRLLEQSIRDDVFRAGIVRRFDHYFEVETPLRPRVKAAIASFF